MPHPSNFSHSAVQQTEHFGRLDARQSLRSALTSMMAEALAERQLSQVDAARMCDTDQPTLSKILAGRKQSASVEKLLCWLMALGWDVEIHLKRAAAAGKPAVMFDE
ncbi:XRE family transcriptional regulator [Rhizobium leguminosarum]|uniref:XRE family transcriptional regulator n=1 Tax=Rhizobium leguminosarum TaxID=384 RepID=UPI001C972E00|nr:XRE family transcriptional regulator [Rhizobium leguminosarum]MBY5701206.1 XRE family transcriptional regulator [Rhizobium leguminosarum]